MNKVFQSKVCSIFGDCHVAAVATVLGLSLKEVPNFNSYGKFGKKIEHNFMWDNGYMFNKNLKAIDNELKEESSINGLFLACVRSKTYPNSSCAHAIVIDDNGICVHDPNPNSLWLGIDVLNDPGFYYVEIWKPHKLNTNGDDLKYFINNHKYEIMFERIRTYIFNVYYKLRY